ncbi:MAG: FHA domain-containing protein [Prochlorotrichaceae cyanobacterium]
MLSSTPSPIQQPYPRLTLFPPSPDNCQDDAPITIHFSDLIPEENSGTALVITLGRGKHNHIDLPDPCQKISREHCCFRYDRGRWGIEDEGSANGTYIQRSGCATEIDVRRSGREVLQEGDVILILGAWQEEDQPLFWRIHWQDPGKTDPIANLQGRYLEYHQQKQKLYLIDQNDRHSIRLIQQQTRLVDYLACSARDQICSAEELLTVIWPEPFGHTPNDVSRLVWSVRHKIERDSGEPQFLQTIKGKAGGYRLLVSLVDP